MASRAAMSLAGFTLAAALFHAGSALAQQQAPAVTVAKPLQAQVVDYDEYTGRFEAVQQVDIQAQVSGYLDAIHFEDGQLVQKGDLLFEIDPRTYQADVDAAQARLESARSSLALAGLDLKRAQKLLPSGAATQETVDTRSATQEAAQAAVDAAAAALKTAKLNLGFTKITAPVSGRISSAKADVGNLIQGGSASATVLTSIVSVDPVYFVFDLSESEFLRYVRVSGGDLRAAASAGTTEVAVRLLDETMFDRTGHIDFIDNNFNQGTGTIRMRAVFPNSDGLLIPGVFGRLRLPVSAPYQALLLPDRAILSDQDNKLVMVVGDDGVVKPQPVVLGDLFNGMRIVKSGIGPDDKVIIDGLLRAHPGAAVTPQEVTLDASGQGQSAQ